MSVMARIRSAEILTMLVADKPASTSVFKHSRGGSVAAVGKRIAMTTLFSASCATQEEQLANR